MVGTTQAAAERKRRQILRHLAEHGPAGLHDLVRATGGDPAANWAVREMRTVCKALHLAGLLSSVGEARERYGLRNGHRLCECGCGVIDETEGRPT